MMFFKRLFSRKEKPVAELPRDFSTQQTQEEQDATRKHMETEMTDARERRGESDARQGNEEAPAEKPGPAPTDDV
jgi:hypothetical protein